MTVDQIIEEIWKLSWYDVLKLAIADDFILLFKIWPVILGISIILIIRIIREE